MGRKGQRGTAPSKRRVSGSVCFAHVKPERDPSVGKPVVSRTGASGAADAGPGRNDLPDHGVVAGRNTFWRTERRLGRLSLPPVSFRAGLWARRGKPCRYHSARIDGAGCDGSLGGRARPAPTSDPAFRGTRSEERRVGGEC